MGQQKIPPTPPETSLAGQTVIVTGGNAGLGLEAARQFLLLGASRVILACRSVARGEEAASALRADPQVSRANPDAVVEVFELDLGDYASGMRFAARVKAEVRELDILLNNAGISVFGYEKSKSGHEMTMQVNCYTYILLCLELLPLLRSTAAVRGRPARITFVGSAMHISQHSLGGTEIPAGTSVVDFFDDKTAYNRFTRYADSKLAVNALTRRLSALAPPSEVIVNNLCPGLVQTGLDKNLPAVLRVVMGLVRKTMARTVDEGARTLIYASAVAGAETNGKFLKNNATDPGTVFNKLANICDRGAAFLNEPEGRDFIDRLWRDVMRDVAAVDAGLESYVTLTAAH